MSTSETTHAGDAMMRWLGQSGKGNHFLQSNAAKWRTFVAGGIGSQAALDFLRRAHLPPEADWYAPIMLNHAKGNGPESFWP
jgi:hypothetical protein